MHAMDRIFSLVTLLSLFMLPQLVARVAVVWWSDRHKLTVVSQYFALVLGTLLAIVVLASVYGLLYSVSPKSVAWYAWINRELPISGDVDVGNEVNVRGSVDVDNTVEVSGKVDVNNEPIKVEIQR
jgi:hypothetical protein